MKNQSPAISVIIPAYHDWGRLKLCVEAISKQDLSSDDYEVIIVNNDPQDKPPEDFEMPINVVLIEEGRPGSYAARNAALKIARGEAIAFTDSDCIPRPEWLSSGLGYLQEGVDRVAGRVELFFQNDRLTWAEIYEKAFSFRQHKSVADGLCVTANLFTWRAVLDEVGHFDDRLMSGGDGEWNRRATAMHKSIVFGYKATVLHPSRAKVAELIGKRKRVAGGAHSTHGLRLADLVKGLIPPVKTIPGLVRDRQLTVHERIVAFIIYYYLKVYRLYLLVRLQVGLEKPSRG